MCRGPRLKTFTRIRRRDTRTRYMHVFFVKLLRSYRLKFAYEEEEIITTARR